MTDSWRIVFIINAGQREGGSGGNDLGPDAREVVALKSVNLTTSLLLTAFVELSLMQMVMSWLVYPVAKEKVCIQFGNGNGHSLVVAVRYKPVRGRLVNFHRPLEYLVLVILPRNPNPVRQIPRSFSKLKILYNTAS